MVRILLILVLMSLMVLLGMAWLRPDAPAGPLAGSNAGATPQDADVSLSVSERRLAQEMAASLANDPYLRDPSFELAPPDSARVTVSASTQFLGQTFQIRPTVQMRFALVDGRVRVVADRMEVGGLPLPERLADIPMREFTEPIERQVNETVRQMEEGSGLELTSVHATENSLVLGFS
jgi:uncharacterized protein YpmS